MGGPTPGTRPWICQCCGFHFTGSFFPLSAFIPFHSLAKCLSETTSRFNAGLMRETQRDWTQNEVQNSVPVKVLACVIAFDVFCFLLLCQMSKCLVADRSSGVLNTFEFLKLSKLALLVFLHSLRTFENKFETVIRDIVFDSVC